MGNFNRGGRGGRGGRDSFGGDRARREMHSAICDECGVRCDVPFRPTGDKPIYCSNCFEDRGGSERRPERSDNRRDKQRPDMVVKSDSQYKKQLDEVINKLDAIISILSTKKEVIEKKPIKKTITKNVTKKEEPKKKVTKKETKKKVAKK